MSQAAFEEVSGFDPLRSLQEGKALGQSKSDEGSTSAAAAEHVYIVFSEETSIDNGIKLIEQQVLGGKKLDVSRIDEKGHAVVAVVSSFDRRQIRSLPEVDRVKVQQPAVKNKL